VPSLFFLSSLIGAGGELQQHSLIFREMSMLPPILESNTPSPHFLENEGMKCHFLTNVRRQSVIL
jgi:hypothetical protein